MSESKRAAKGEGKSPQTDSLVKKAKTKKSQKSFAGEKASPESNNQEVLLKLPGGFEYKMPGKRQRIIVASIVVGLNFLLVIAVGLYFYVPSFKEFIYNIGRG